MTGPRIEAARCWTFGLAIVAALMLASGVAVAQQGPGRHGPDVDAQMARLTTRLQLTADQQQQIRPILESRNEQMVALRSKVRSGAIDRDGARSQMQAIHQETTQKVDAVLTADQRKEYQQYMQEIASRWKSHRGMRGEGGGMGRGPGTAPGPGGDRGSPVP